MRASPPFPAVDKEVDAAKQLLRFYSRVAMPSLRFPFYHPRFSPECSIYLP